jgi:hypothetical protein
MEYVNLKNRIVAEHREKLAKLLARVDSVDNVDHAEMGLLRNYTSKVWSNRFKQGIITLETYKEKTKLTINKDYAKQLETSIAKLDAVASVENIPDEIKIAVEWLKSKTWGANPHAEVWHPYDSFTGSASGCGYDKESAAVAEALNQSNAILKIAYDMIERGEQLPYGLGTSYRILPQFEGGVGVSCFARFFEQAGYTWNNAGSGKMFDCYYITK